MYRPEDADASAFSTWFFFEFSSSGMRPAPCRRPIGLWNFA